MAEDKSLNVSITVGKDFDRLEAYIASEAQMAKMLIEMECMLKEYFEKRELDPTYDPAQDVGINDEAGE